MEADIRRRCGEERDKSVRQHQEIGDDTLGSAEMTLATQSRVLYNLLSYKGDTT